VREVFEECGVTVNVNVLGRRYRLLFFFQGGHEVHVQVYVCDIWTGEIHEIEEMATKWFHKDHIPFDQMWKDDVYWLRGVLDWEVKFEFDEKTFGFGEYEMARNGSPALLIPQRVRYKCTVEQNLCILLLC
jgi:hypothetical protein